MNDFNITINDDPDKGKYHLYNEHFNNINFIVATTQSLCSLLTSILIPPSVQIIFQNSAGLSLELIQKFKM